MRYNTCGSSDLDAVRLKNHLATRAPALTRGLYYGPSLRVHCHSVLRSCMLEAATNPDLTSEDIFYLDASYFPCASALPRNDIADSFQTRAERMILDCPCASTPLSATPLFIT